MRIPTMDAPNKDPLHGITLAQIVEFLVDHYGWKDLGGLVKINSFNFEPSVKSSLKFLRRTPWARAKVEDLYLETLEMIERKKKRS